MAYNNLMNYVCKGRKLETTCRALDDEIKKGFTLRNKHTITEIKLGWINGGKNVIEVGKKQRCEKFACICEFISYK